MSKPTRVRKLATAVAKGTGTASQTRKYQTQWAAQFFTAAELTRKGCLVSLTLGNAQRTDLLVVSPTGTPFKVQCKGQSTRNFWLIKRPEPENNLFYVLTYLPQNKSPQYFILTSREVQREHDDHKQRKLKIRKKYREDINGFNWTVVFPYENKWDKLPK